MDVNEIPVTDDMRRRFAAVLRDAVAREGDDCIYALDNGMLAAFGEPSRYYDLAETMLLIARIADRPTDEAGIS